MVMTMITEPDRR